MVNKEFHLGVNRGILIMGRDLNRTRWRVEAERLRRYCPGWKLELQKKGESKVMVRATGSVSCRGRSYGLVVKIPSGYPYQMPRAFPDGWRPGASPHIYDDGSLCVMKSSQWRATYSLALYIKKLTLWIHKFRVWKKRKKWPGRAQD